MTPRSMPASWPRPGSCSSGYGIEPALIEQAGDPAQTIERIAQDGGYDMVVVGSRHLGAVSRVLQGSVSEHVATHAPATVVIAR